MAGISLVAVDLTGGRARHRADHLTVDDEQELALLCGNVHRLAGVDDADVDALGGDHDGAALRHAALHGHRPGGWWRDGGCPVSTPQPAPVSGRDRAGQGAQQHPAMADNGHDGAVHPQRDPLPGQLAADPQVPRWWDDAVHLQGLPAAGRAGSWRVQLRGEAGCWQLRGWPGRAPRVPAGQGRAGGGGPGGGEGHLQGLVRPVGVVVLAPGIQRRLQRLQRLKRPVITEQLQLQRLVQPLTLSVRSVASRKQPVVFNGKFHIRETITTVSDAIHPGSNYAEDFPPLTRNFI